MPEPQVSKIWCDRSFPVLFALSRMGGVDASRSFSNQAKANEMLQMVTSKGLRGTIEQIQ